MPQVSEFNAYFTRKYVENGIQKSENPIECAQLCYDVPPSNNSTYYRYQENAPTISYTNGGGTAFSPSYYASYNPGLIYLPEKYYTHKDLFPNGWNDMSPKEFVLETITRNWAFDSATGANFMYRRSIIDNKFKFYDELSGVTVIPEISLQISQGQSTLLGVKRSVGLMIHFLMFDSSLNPETFVWGDVNGINYRIRNSEWMVPQSNGKYTKLHDIDKLSNGYMGISSIDGCQFGYMTTDGYVSLSEAESKVDKCFEIFNKIKIYPAVGYLGYDTTLETYKTLQAFDYGDLHPNVSGFLIDLSDSPHFPTSGFYVTARSLRINDAFTLEWTGKGPEANNPDITDDPNDKDPGIGPGQNPNDKGGDGDHDNTSDKIKPPTIPTLSASGAGLITIYNPTQSALESLGKSLWSPNALEAIKQYFTNPMDTILGLSIVPVQPKTASSREIMLGLYKTGVTAPLVDSDYVIVNCGSIMINRYYGSYLDYSPYTKIKCYLPYIGEVDVNPDEVMQTSLMVLYYVNVVTGDIVAMICSDETILYTAAGNCVRQLPLSSADYASIINTAVSAVSTIAVAVATAGVGSATVAAAGASKAATDETKKLASARSSANNVDSANNLVGDVTNAKMNYQHVGSIGTGSGQLSYQKPYLIIERPNLDLANNYKSFVGYPCNMTLQIGRCRGFTQIEASNISVPNATDEEVAEIKELLLGGVII